MCFTHFVTDFGARREILILKFLFWGEFCFLPTFGYLAVHLTKLCTLQCLRLLEVVSCPVALHTLI